MDALSDYESELYPIIFEDLDYNWYQIDYSEMTYDELLELYNKQMESLKELRLNEPPRKRGKKSEYKHWIKNSHDLRDEINEIAAEIRKRAQRGLDNGKG